MSLEQTPAEKRLGEYLDGLFWISVFGLAFVIGGAVLLTKLGFRDLVVIGYVILSTFVFLINFGFSLFGAISLMRSSKDGRLTMQPPRHYSAGTSHARTRVAENGTDTDTGDECYREYDAVI